jgi:SAM-dependent methyltransferase
MGRPARRLDRYNRAFYERCWRAGSVVPLGGVVAPAGRPGRVVEVGCGLRPRLPIETALFVDVSRTACAKLRRAGAPSVCASVDRLPFRAGTVRALHAYEVLEHVEDDAAAVAELRRVLAADGLLVVSAPLHPGRWDGFDRVVGHARRYDAAALVALMEGHGLTLEGFAPFGMRPRGRLLTRLGLYYLTRRPRLAFRYEERFLRLSRAARAPVIVQTGGAADFIAAAATMDGAVTAWRAASIAVQARRTSARGVYPAMVSPPDTLST